jgi:hypothetical protein
VPSQHDRTLRRVLTIVVVFAAVLILGLTYFYGFYVPEHNIVTIAGGSWLLNGGSSGLGISVGCSDCGQRLAPGSQFTIDVNVQISGCSSYYCGYYRVDSFSVNAPYVLVQVAPSNLPVSEYAGSFNTWALTVEAPSSAGHYALSGIVGVTYA